jgi:hypothetical protein
MQPFADRYGGDEEFVAQTVSQVHFSRKPSMAPTSRHPDSGLECGPSCIETTYFLLLGVSRLYFGASMFFAGKG